MSSDSIVREDIVIGRVEMLETPRSSPALPLDLDDRDGPNDPLEICALIEALLLSSPEPTSLQLLARGAGLPVGAVIEALSKLNDLPERGWGVQQHGDQVQLVTAPRFARYVRRFLGLEREVRLSVAALETLAIIAYQQPVTRTDIEAVRGVDCTGVLSTLLSRGLVEQSGRVEAPGQAFEYAVTGEFLRRFGLDSLHDLPDLGVAGNGTAIEQLEGAIFQSRTDLLIETVEQEATT